MGGGGSQQANLVIGGGRGEGAGGGLPPPARGPGARPRENFSDCRCIFVSFSAFFRQYQNSDKPALCL
jgi:hypothetical protein